MSENTDILKTSYLRGNIVSWLPIMAEDTVLYIGEETDAAAKKIGKMSSHLTCISGIQESGGDFDYIICLGHLAALSQPIQKSNKNRIKAAAEAVKAMRKMLKDQGKLILAVPNKLGLRYWAGEKEEGSERYFAGIENNSGLSCYSKRELEVISAEAGFSPGKFYYPFPDYRFAMSVYSEEYLPKKGELIDQIGNFTAERLVLFDEGKAADMLLEEHKFEDFANSYLLILSNGGRPSIEKWEGEQVGFVKFSNDRGKQHNIETYITISGDGKKHLVKCPDNACAAPQIEKILKSKAALTRQYEKSRLLVNDCMSRQDCVELEFLTGHTMEEEIDCLLDSGSEEDACRKILAVIQEISAVEPVVDFAVTEGFTEVFGEVNLPQGLRAAETGDIDMILPNILVQDEKWILIDYEWTFHFPIPLRYMVYRTLHYYVNTTAKRRVLEKYDLFGEAGITENEIAAYEKMEENFQKYVMQGHIPMREVYKEAGKPSYHITSVLNVIDEMERRRALQVYFDRGNGFVEEESEFYMSEALDGTYVLQIPFGPEVTKLRIDPGSQACTVDIRLLCFKEGPQKSFTFLTNGHKIEKNLYLFDTEDPNILFDDIPPGSLALQLDIRIDSMSLTAAKAVALKIDPKYRLKKLIKNED